MKYVTGKDNAQFMRNLLTQQFHRFDAFAKELYQAGMIKGLRRLTIETEIPPMTAALSVNYTCSDCLHFLQDEIGFGAGIGQCAKGVSRYGLLWPKQVACPQIGLRFDVKF
jgi:hypothetical protein